MKERRFCKSERKRILEDFTQSNLSIEQYCQEHQISEMIIQLAIDEKMEGFADQGLALAPLKTTDFVEVDFSKVVDEDESFTDLENVEDTKEEDKLENSNNVIRIIIRENTVLELPLDIKKRKLISIIKAVSSL